MFKNVHYLNLDLSSFSCPECDEVGFLVVCLAGWSDMAASNDKGFLCECQECEQIVTVPVTFTS